MPQAPPATSSSPPIYLNRPYAWVLEGSAMARASHLLSPAATTRTPNVRPVLVVFLPPGFAGVFGFLLLGFPLSSDFPILPYASWHFLS